MSHGEHILHFDELNITLADLCVAMGYGNSQPEEHLLQLADDLLHQVAAVTHPRFCFRIKEGQLDNGALYVDGIHFDTGKVIAQQLKKSEQFAFFLATAGAEFQQFSEKLKKENDLLDVFMVDAIGSEIAERTADVMEKSLQQEIQISDWQHTNRFSPGYCGWSVAGQKELFSLFGNNTCGISLTPSCLMTPVKSVSGVIGVGSFVSKKEYSCRLCGYENCFKRKTHAFIN